MFVVKDLLKKKGAHVYSVTPETKLRDVIKTMTQNDIGAILVLEGEKIVGIFSERDFTRAVAKNDALNLDTPVSEFMIKNVLYIRSNLTIDDCMAIMINRRIRHLPVVEEKKLLGIVSIRDLVSEVILQKEIQIHSLENFITGREYSG